MINNKTVYVGMCADILHHGHINIIKEATKLGKVTIGLLTDEAIASYKRVPILSYEERKKIVNNIKGVFEVIPQKTLSYKQNLMIKKPDFVVHGDDWRTGPQKNIRKEVIQTLKQWGGEIKEVQYTKNVSSTFIQNKIKEMNSPQKRSSMLKRLIKSKKIVRIIEAHNGLTGLMVEKIKANGKEFDGMWLSSLTHSTSKGKPDIQYIDITTINSTINEIFDVTTKPMIVDLDNGGKTEHFKFAVRTLERIGVSAVIIEDKIGNKRNSLFMDTSNQTQDDKGSFAHKIKEGKKCLKTKEFMIIARIESLILEKGVTDAIQRAKTYIESGVDGIMIHSKIKDTKEIVEFCKKFEKFRGETPLIVVPSSYNHLFEKQLIELGANVVIYANHLLRSAYPSMKNVMEKILINERSLECDDDCLPIKEILNLIPTEPDLK
tara:strand:- start:947 stop:2248 length:1302 start_codon:yes stop_codon:yes gene_type:complete